MKSVLFCVLLLLGVQLAQAQSLNLAVTQQPCNNNGIATATFSGLTLPVTVTWYLGSNPPTIQTITSGNTAVYTNWNGSPLAAVATGSNNLTADDYIDAPAFNVQISTVPAACPVPGSATVTPSGGAAPYTYQWFQNGTTNLVSTSNPASLPGGGYELIVTDANGCTVTNDSMNIYSTPAFNVAVATTNANCTNGTATVTGITGAGTPPYTYLWSNGATTTSISSLVSGNYNVTVTDATGCDATGYAYVQQSVQVPVNVTATPATCVQTNGAAIAFASGGTPPFTYSWSNGATTQSLTNLPANWYSVTATDANGCFGTGYASVTSTTPINVTYTSVASSCTSPTGSATLNITGGAAPYTISWNTFPAQTGNTATNLAPGSYYFTVVDANNCVRSGTAVVNPVNIINTTISSTNPSCTAANGSVSVTASGGNAPYSYSWNTTATTPSITGLIAGYYAVTVTDASGCSALAYKNLGSTSPVNLGISTVKSSCIYNSDGTATAVATGGTAPYTYSWSSGANSAMASGLLTGNYWVNVIDANGCTASDYTFVPYDTSSSCYCTIKGTVYHDVNNNCVKDAGEPGIPNIQMHLSGVGYVYTNSNGVYSFKAPAGNRTLSETIQSFYPLASCQNNNISVSVSAATGCVQTFDFANVINPIHDISISTWDYNFPVPGYDYNMAVIISNQGTVTEPSVLAGMALDSQLSVPTFIPVSSVVFTNPGYNWYKSNSGTVSLAPAASKLVLMDFNVPTNIPVNTGLVYKDSAVYAGPMTNWINDYTPWNNVDYFTSSVVSSYDPNFKEVSPKGLGATGMITAADSVLEYMVHFQNLGNYHAQKVVVLDTLDADLDWTTLRPIYQSHPCVVTITDAGVVSFTFNNINLPAEMYNEPASHGLLSYSIKTKDNLPLGTQFTNSAAIYFDYNEPVITNTTLNTLGIIQDVPGNPGSEKSEFSLYPNPASKLFYARINNAGKAKVADIRVLDMNGRTLISKSEPVQPGVQNVAIDSETLSPGLYFVILNLDGNMQTQKLVIMK
ncbi:MAG: T9SS type A sorting domain-containing protein [Sphingobacteriales bacterium]|nr:MAG: T9SS type A sorting domain-containing protein [Sphingobacteriales bacterium]